MRTSLQQVKQQQHQQQQHQRKKKKRRQLLMLDDRTYQQRVHMNRCNSERVLAKRLSLAAHVHQQHTQA
jgi:hypothetical protein